MRKEKVLLEMDGEVTSRHAAARLALRCMPTVAVVWNYYGGLAALQLESPIFPEQGIFTAP